MNYIDLFSGAGGLGLGFEQAGFKNLFSIEFNENAAKTYRYNFPQNKLIEKDIRSISNKDIQSLVNGKDVDVIIGGPPCQGFSMAGNIGRKFIDDDRNKLFKEFVRVVDVLKPKMFVMENVARMATHNHGETIKEISSEFEKLGYKVQFKILNAVNYNVPQNRRRIFIVGTTGQEFKFPKPSDKKTTVKEAIDDLPKLKSGEKSDIPNHFAMNHSEQMLRKMSYVKDGGDRYQIPKEFRPKSGDSRKYIRYASNEPSVTVTGDMRKIFHYSQNRALTPRELARLQTFPDSFIFIGNSISIQQQIGNAVPPKLALAVANQVKECLKDSHKSKIQVVFPKVNYIGNKMKLANWIADNVPEDTDTILDLFSGGGSVSYELKKRGYQVWSNDALYSSYSLSKALIENSKIKLKKSVIDNALDYTPSYKDKEKVKFLANNLYFEEEIPELSKLVGYVNSLRGYDKYIYLSLLRRAMIRKLPYSRMNINWENIKLLRDEEYSYKKYGRRRAYHNKGFAYHMYDELDEYNNSIFDNGRKNRAFQKDAFSLVKNNIKLIDTVYLDPPYPGTMNNYNGFYGCFDKIFDKEIMYNDLTKSKTFLLYLENIIEELSKKAKHMMISINSNSNPGYEEIVNMCEFYGKTSLKKRKHNYQVSGKKKKNNNMELLIIVDFYK